VQSEFSFDHGESFLAFRMTAADDSQSIIRFDPPVTMCEGFRVQGGTSVDALRDAGRTGCSIHIALRARYLAAGASSFDAERLCRHVDALCDTHRFYLDTGHRRNKAAGRDQYAGATPARWQSMTAAELEWAAEDEAAGVDDESGIEWDTTVAPADLSADEQLYLEAAMARADAIEYSTSCSSTLSASSQASSPSSSASSSSSSPAAPPRGRKRLPRAPRRS
jgi:hypothetical protein